MNIKLGNKFIGPDFPPFIIAEMSGNHNQSLERALEIVDAAAATGADALKIQTYHPDTMTIDLSEREFFISDKGSLWKGNSLYELYRTAMTPWEWHEPIKKRCEEKGLLFFSTPFDYTAVDFLEKLDVDFYKIASFENTDLPLIKRVAQTKKPIIISTGMASLAEIHEAVTTAKENGCPQIILLKCTSAYPAPFEEMNISTIRNMRETFGVEVGLSDHSMGSAVPIAAVAFGANVIEKHFTLKRADGGVDSAFSMEPEEFRQMIVDVKNAKLAMGKVFYGLTESEKKSRIFRRTLYVVKEMKKGEKFTPENTRAIRPGHGLLPKYYDVIIGKTAKNDIPRGTALSWDLLE